MFTMLRQHFGVVHLMFLVFLVLNLGLANASALVDKILNKDQAKKDSTLIINQEYPGSDSLVSTETTSDLPENEVSITMDQHEEGLSITNSLHPISQENVLKNNPSVINVIEPSQNAAAVLQSERMENVDDANTTTEVSDVDIEGITPNFSQHDSKHTTLEMNNFDQMDPTTSSSVRFTNSFSNNNVKENQTIKESKSSDKNASAEDIEHYKNSYFNALDLEGGFDSENTSSHFENDDHSSHGKSTPNRLVGPIYLTLASVSTPKSLEEKESKYTSTSKLELILGSNNNHRLDNQTDFTDSVQANQLKEEGDILKINQDTSLTNLDEEKNPSEQNQLEKNDARAISSDTENSRYPENLPIPAKLYGFNKERYDQESRTEEVSEGRSPSLHNYQYLQKTYDEKSKADSEYTSSELHNTVNTEDNNAPGTLFEDCSDCDIRILPIKPLEQRSTAKTEMESLPTSKITFGDLPEGRELQINSLGLSDGIFLFSYISEFLSWIQPNDFPVELLKEALKNQMTWISLITQSLQVEAGFVACLVVGVLLALAVPVVVLSHACYRMGGRPEDQADDNGGWAGNCRRRTLVFILQLLLVLLCGGMVAMFVTNEQLSSAVVQSRQVVEVALGDVSTFVHNSQLHLHFLLTQSLDQTLQAVYADLDNVDTLLGRPIQRELVRETGLDVALDTLSDLTKEAKSVTQQVERFMEEVQTTQELLLSSRDKLSDLRQQVELFRRACGPRDRTMCDTIDASGLEVTLKLDRIKTDERLNRMRRMGGVGLELAASEAKDHFLTIPSRVEAETRDAREDVRRLLTRQRAEVDEHTLALERLARDLTSKVGEARFQAGYWTQDLDQLEYWRWIVCMGGGAAVLMIWMLLLCSMCCGCCGSEKAAGPTILVTIVLMCLFSTALWTLVMVGLLVGGHTEVFLCRPLYDEPEFRVLSRLVDQPGVFYDQPSGGFIGNVIYGNDTIDVPVTHVLKDCREGRPVYPALGLHRVMDVASAVGRGSWGDVTSHLRSVRANLSHLEVLSPALTDQLGDLLATLSVNFTEHRIQMSRPVTGKDLDSFAKQLDNIGNQLRDLATASRMETLSSRTRRLIDSHIRPLEGRKDALVYQLTALEVQTQPLQRQVNQSLSHLKTIQFFINSQGQTISEKKSREYVERLMSYVEQLRDHVTRSARETVAPCRPIWDIFNNSRLFLCHHIVDPLNGFWFATMWCLLVLLVATPVCLKLVDYYRAQGGRSSGSPSENLVSSEQGGGWSTPGYDIKCSKDHDGGCE